MGFPDETFELRGSARASRLDPARDPEGGGSRISVRHDAVRRRGSPPSARTSGAPFAPPKAPPSCRNGALPKKETPRPRTAVGDCSMTGLQRDRVTLSTARPNTPSPARAQPRTTRAALARNRRATARRALVRREVDDARQAQATKSQLPPGAVATTSRGVPCHAAPPPVFGQHGARTLAEDNADARGVPLPSSHKNSKHAVPRRVHRTLHRGHIVKRPSHAAPLGRRLRSTDPAKKPSATPAHRIQDQGATRTRGRSDGAGPSRRKTSPTLLPQIFATRSLELLRDDAPRFQTKRPSTFDRAASRGSENVFKRELVEFHARRPPR